MQNEKMDLLIDSTLPHRKGCNNMTPSQEKKNLTCIIPYLCGGHVHKVESEHTEYHISAQEKNKEIESISRTSFIPCHGVRNGTISQ